MRALALALLLAAGCGGVVVEPAPVPAERSDAGQDADACIQKTCQDMGATCGNLPDGCGGLIDCGNLGQGCTSADDCNDGNPCHVHACDCGFCVTSGAIDDGGMCE